MQSIPQTLPQTFAVKNMLRNMIFTGLFFVFLLKINLSFLKNPFEHGLKIDWREAP
jgi:hypothetical protein